MKNLFHNDLIGQIILDAELATAVDEQYHAPRLWIPPTPQAPWHLQVLRDTNPLTPTETVDNPHCLLEFQAFWPVKSRPQNQLQFEPEGQEGQVAIHFAFSETDHVRMRAMEADVQQLAEQLGRWRRGCEPTWIRDGSVHLMGTCRMDGSGRAGVANAVGQVHGFDNLYLATVGLIPTPVAVNPTLTALAVALHTCDHLSRAG